MTSLKILVDRELCEVNGVCATVAPELFEISEDDQLNVVKPQPSAAEAPAAEEAVRRCPKAALALSDE
jgi:ferredoxin